jgi:hypothetical protein
MKIRAGLGFDEQPPNDVPDCLGEALLGPAGLLQSLEFRAGLVPPVQPHAERVARYARALRAAATLDSFYAQSLEADETATADTLLWWRDYALDHGWCGGDSVTGSPADAGASADADLGSPGRLAALAEVERQVEGLAPCLSERLARLRARTGRLIAGVAQITLVEPREDWPPAWRHLFAALEAGGLPLREDVSPPRAGAPRNTDLGRLQRALLDPTDTGDQGFALVPRCENAEAL